MRDPDALPPHHPRRNPFSEDCALYLCRVCGACVHFSGACLVELGQRCGFLGRPVDGPDCAMDCEYWSRKSAGPVSDETRKQGT